ncbi:hypothetical protein EYF80_058702 [Liparis tanakae]|uniref:Uncharacterized protein n=1 Tax=Liparis tanakae TaxID=230148 RepID=A0A4Z2EQD3_9TELE|nr:hypothetical protein EYF80_058702 [Liparis tanakae]
MTAIRDANRPVAFTLPLRGNDVGTPKLLKLQGAVGVWVQGHFDLLLMGRAGIEPCNSRLRDDCSAPSSTRDVEAESNADPWVRTVNWKMERCQIKVPYDKRNASEIQFHHAPTTAFLPQLRAPRIALPDSSTAFRGLGNESDRRRPEDR